MKRLGHLNSAVGMNSAIMPQLVTTLSRGRRIAACEPARPAPHLRQPCRMGGNARRCGGAGHGTRAERDRRTALHQPTARAAGRVAWQIRSVDSGASRYRVSGRANPADAAPGAVNQ